VLQEGFGLAVAGGRYGGLASAQANAQGVCARRVRRCVSWCENQRVRVQGDGAELINALLKEGPFFTPKPESTGRFSRLSSIAKGAAKASAFTRAPSFARSASNILAASRTASSTNRVRSQLRVHECPWLCAPVSVRV